MRGKGREKPFPKFFCTARCSLKEEFNGKGGQTLERAAQGMPRLNSILEGFSNFSDSVKRSFNSFIFTLLRAGHLGVSPTVSHIIFEDQFSIPPLPDPNPTTLWETEELCQVGFQWVQVTPDLAIWKKQAFLDNYIIQGNHRVIALYFGLPWINFLCNLLVIFSFSHQLM